MGGEQGQQVDGFLIEVVEVITLQVEHAHDVILHLEWNREF
jgi:hypothetical protein